MQKNVTPGRRKGCPNYPPEFKQQLVAASCEPGISISKLALENGINANLLFKWLNGLAAKVQTALKDDPMSGHVFIFRGRSGSQVKLLWSTGDGLCLLTKRLERGRFAWPSARDGKVFLTQAQLAMLLEGIDWRQPKRLLTSLTML
ncbi:IS66 family insertion sequence element accessory protein TnpB [Escherichia coli]|uniref:IS66 family insertion sequence element accessory protein TnpB n=1 Tax=Escherichia coli TaxID=562 RepID=UPI00345AAD99